MVPRSTVAARGGVVFESFPDRFLGVGTDSAHNGEWQYFVGRISRYQLLLSPGPSVACVVIRGRAQRAPPMLPHFCANVALQWIRWKLRAFAESITPSNPLRQS